MDWGLPSISARQSSDICLDIKSNKLIKFLRICKEYILHSSLCIKNGFGQPLRNN